MTAQNNDRRLGISILDLGLLSPSPGLLALASNPLFEQLSKMMEKIPRLTPPFVINSWPWNLTDSFSLLDQRERAPETTRVAPVPRPLPPAVAQAWRQYQEAIALMPELKNKPKQVYRRAVRPEVEIRAHEGIVPSLETWLRYVREARRLLGQPKMRGSTRLAR